MVFPRNIIQLSTVCLACIGIAYLTNIYFQDSLLYAPICLFLALPFFIFGYAMQLSKDFVYKTLNMQTIQKLSATLIFFILSVTLFSYQGESNMSKHDYGNNIIAFYICAIFGIMYVIVFSSLFKVKNKKCLYHLQIANNGLPLMIGLQIILINAIKHIIGIYAFHIFGATILSMVIMVVTYPLTVISIKYFPIVLGKRQ